MNEMNEMQNSPNEPQFEKRGEYVVRRLSGETLLVPVRANAADLDWIYVLNETASAIWDTLDSPSTAGQIVTVLVRRFDADEVRVSRDVATYLASLKEGGLIRDRSEKAAGS